MGLSHHLISFGCVLCLDVALYIKRGKACFVYRRTKDTSMWMLSLRKIGVRRIQTKMYYFNIFGSYVQNNNRGTLSSSRSDTQRDKGKEIFLILLMPLLMRLSPPAAAPSPPYRRSHGGSTTRFNAVLPETSGECSSPPIHLHYCLYLSLSLSLP